MPTFVSPASILWRVARVVNARSATTDIGSRRRRRASWISAPSFLSARLTDAGGWCGVGICALQVTYPRYMYYDVYIVQVVIEKSCSALVSKVF